MEKNIKNDRTRQGAALTVRRFVIKETYSGERKLSELLTELLCAEYRKREEKANK